MLRILLMVKPDHHILMLRLQEPWQVTMHGSTTETQLHAHGCHHGVPMSSHAILGPKANEKYHPPSDHI
jgi:hypothetical protein